MDQEHRYILQPSPTGLFIIIDRGFPIANVAKSTTEPLLSHWPGKPGLVTGCFMGVGLFGAHRISVKLTCEKVWCSAGIPGLRLCYCIVVLLSVGSRGRLQTAAFTNSTRGCERTF